MSLPSLDTIQKALILTFALVIVVTRCRPLKLHIQRIIDNRWDMEVNDSGGRGHVSPPTETLLDVKSWTCCLPHERTGRDGVTKVHPASTTITRVIWKTCIEYYLCKITWINWVELHIGFNYNNNTLCLSIPTHPLGSKRSNPWNKQTTLCLF